VAVGIGQHRGLQNHLAPDQGEMVPDAVRCVGAVRECLEGWTCPSRRNNAVSARVKVSGSFSGSQWAEALLCLVEGCSAAVMSQKVAYDIHLKEIQEKLKIVQVK
jgi:hypothetical protein